MLKKALLAAVLAVSLLVVPAWASLDFDGTPWAGEFTGDGWPTVRDPTFMTDPWFLPVECNWYWNRDAKFTVPGGFPGWLYAQGNPAYFTWIPISRFEKETPELTKAGGWTVEWAVVGISPPRPEDAIIFTVDGVVRLQDDSGKVSVNYDSLTNTVSISDDAAGTPRDYASVDPTLEHTYRLVRQPGSSTVELYIDNDFSSPAAQVTLGDGSFVGRFNAMCNSNYDASWDFWRYHTGATIPEPATMLVLAIGVGLALLRRRR